MNEAIDHGRRVHLHFFHNAVMLMRFSRLILRKQPVPCLSLKVGIIMKRWEKEVNVGGGLTQSPVLDCAV